MPDPAPYLEPAYCRLDAYTALRDHLPQLGTTRGLVRCAAAVSMHELEDADLIQVETELDDYGRQVLDRVHRPEDPRALVAHTHHVLFEEARFRGNRGDYTDPHNSYLPSVLRTRLGLPITLALVYKAVLDRVGVRAEGINAPGHFLAAIPAEATGHLGDQERVCLVDPFAGGRLLARHEALARVGLTTPAAGPEHDDPLRPASHKQWLLRLLRNLTAGFEQRGQDNHQTAMLEMAQLVEAEG